nr:amidohydrolase [Sulfuracidifex tepidarius]
MKDFTVINCSLVVVSPWEVKSRVKVHVKDGVIDDVGDYQSGDVLDCEGGVLMSGLVNSHTHTPMSLLRGYKDDLDLHDWLRAMWEKEDDMSKEVMNVGSEISMIEMISSGTTSFVDMYFNPEGVRDLSEKYKVRAFAGETFMDTRESPEAVARRQRSLSSSRYFRPIVNVHSLYTASLESVRKAYEISEEQGTWIHMHISETREEVFQIKKRTGKFPIQLLHDEGLIDRIQAVHVGWVTNQELKYLSNATHCPTSNMKLATAGAFPFKEMYNAGANITLGTDGAASNNSLDMFREMKTAVLVQRHSYWDLWVKASHVLQASTLDGYKLIGVNGGEIRKGMVADMIILDPRRLRPLSEDRVLSNVVYNTTGDSVRKVLVDGNLIYDEEVKERFMGRLDELYSSIKSF